MLNEQKDYSSKNLKTIANTTLAFSNFSREMNKITKKSKFDVTGKPGLGKGFSQKRSLLLQLKTKKLQ